MRPPVIFRRKNPRVSGVLTSESASRNADETLNSPPGEIAEPVTDAATPDEEKQTSIHMSLREHLVELRTRVLRCVIAIFVAFLAVFYFAPTVRSFLEKAVTTVLPPDGALTFADFTEPFMVDMHIAFVLGLFVAAPYIFYQVWAFIAPGLYESERKYIVPIAACSAFFFIAGGAFCYFVVIPFSVSFFIEYGTSSGGAKPLITLANTYRFILRLMLAFGVMFEMPLFSLFLARFRIVTAKRLRTWRKYAILTSFIVAAIITPPDVLTQLLLAGPLILLYEISILVAVFAAPSPKKAV